MTDNPDSVQTLGSFDLAQVMEYLPHRYPFLLIDRLLEVNDDYSGIGLKNVTVNEPQFTGHFPSQPIFPGVLLVEGMAQTGGAIVLINEGSAKSTSEVFFMAIDNVKFRRPVVPGDQVEYHLRLMQKRRNVYRYAGEARVDGAKVAEAEMTAMVTRGE